MFSSQWVRSGVAFFPFHWINLFTRPPLSHIHEWGRWLRGSFWNCLLACVCVYSMNICALWYQNYGSTVDFPKKNLEKTERRIIIIVYTNFYSSLLCTESHKKHCSTITLFSLFYLRRSRQVIERWELLLLLLLLLWGDYFEVMTLKAKVNFFWSRSTSLFFLHSVFPP